MTNEEITSLWNNLMRIGDVFANDGKYYEYYRLLKDVDKIIKNKEYDIEVSTKDKMEGNTAARRLALSLLFDDVVNLMNAYKSEE